MDVFIDPDNVGTFRAVFELLWVTQSWPELSMVTRPRQRTLEAAHVNSYAPVRGTPVIMMMMIWVTEEKDSTQTCRSVVRVGKGTETEGKERESKGEEREEWKLGFGAGSF